MSVLKLDIKSNNKIKFNIDSIITKKISCIQYMLLKYGLTKEHWEKFNLTSDWLGFEYLKKVLNKDILNSTKCMCNIECDKNIKFNTIKSNNKIERVEYSEKLDNKNIEEIITCLIYPLTNCKLDLKSIDQFIELFKK